VITGGAGFLGRQHADAVLAAGGIPVLLDLGAEGLTQAADELEAKFGRRPMTVVCDVTNESGVDAAFDEVMRVQGEIHGVVNNAAYNGRAEFGSAYFSPIDDYPIDAWRKTVDINLTGVFIVTKHALRRMVPQRRGVLVTIASDVGVISPDPRIYEELPPDRYFNTPPSYSATKAAVINLTRHVATHYAKFGIRANALSPAGMFNNQAPEFMAKLTNLIPLGRMARPGEHEATIVFLLSDASSFITGANLMADGGRTAW
jgi:NAD(P)-dependent dehydrogenase (short-subunit alcohol dehydrogenase family)